MTLKKSTTLSDSDISCTEHGLPKTEFDAILNSIPDIIIRLNLSGKVVWWNKNFEDVTSLTKEKLLSYSLSDVFKSFNDISIESMINKAIDDGYSQVDACLLITQNNERYHLKSTLINNSLDKEILIVGRDINDRSIMADALKQNQIQLQNLIDALPFLVFLISVDDKYLLANKKFCNFMGVSQSDVVGAKSNDVFNEEINEYLLQDNQKIFIEKCLVHYDGILEINHDTLNLSVDKFPLFDESKNIYAICTVVEDLTAQYQMQRQLQQNQKMEALGQLTGGIAHDFNNVLASILGYTGLAKRCAATNYDDTISDYLNQITRAGERARDLVQQLLAFSRGDTGGLKILDPKALAKETITMLTSLIPSSIKLSLNIRNDNIKHYIEVDPVQFNQSVMNLVINAKDAIVDETGEIDVSLEYLPQVQGVCDSCHISFSGEYIQLSVSDSGTGISKDIQSRIFDPFFTTKDIGKGSGMGLSMLHGIVHGSGGHIVVNSNNSLINTGTTIHIYFPAVESKNIQDYKVCNRIEKSKNNVTGKTVLVIDDEFMITDYLTELLKDEGYNVISFNNPVKGLSYFKDNSHEIDIIITDQTMPDLTGLELAKTIYNSNYQIPIILCTGYTDLTRETLNKDSGIEVSINKPFDDVTLLHHISRLLT